MIKNKSLLTFCFLLMVITINSQNNLFKKEVFIKGSDSLNYRILYPENFSENENYPLVLFLHGAGERGNDNEKQLVHGSKLFTKKINRGAFPAIVIFPQCPKNSYWSNAEVDRSNYPIKLTFPENKPPTKPMELVMDLLDEFSNKPFVQKEKIYVGGLSMGGMGTFEILARKPDAFAAAFAICGGGNLQLVKNYATKVDLWIFHGANDNVVDPKNSVDIVNEILKNNGKPNFTLYADANHNSWDPAFAEPDLLQWLFSKTKLSIKQ